MILRITSNNCFSTYGSPDLDSPTSSGRTSDATGIAAPAVLLTSVADRKTCSFRLDSRKRMEKSHPKMLRLLEKHVVDLLRLVV